MTKDILQLGSIVDEVRKQGADENIVVFVEELLRFEKYFGSSYKPQIRDLLKKYARGEHENNKN